MSGVFDQDFNIHFPLSSFLFPLREVLRKHRIRTHGDGNASRNLLHEMREERNACKWQERLRSFFRKRPETRCETAGQDESFHSNVVYLELSLIKMLIGHANPL